MRAKITWNKNRVFVFSFLLGLLGLVMSTPTFAANSATSTHLTSSAVLSTPTLGYTSCVEQSKSHQIYCVGGIGVGGNIYDTMLRFRPEIPEAKRVATKLPGGSQAGLSCTENTKNHNIYCFGAYGRKIIEIISPTVINEKSTLIPGVARIGMTCAEQSATHIFYCFGGFAGITARDTIISYNPTADTATTMKSKLPQGWTDMQCVEYPTTHKIYCLGGVNEKNEFNHNIYEYSPETDTIAITGSQVIGNLAESSCVFHSATGSIVCLGGSITGKEVLQYSPADNTINTISSSWAPDLKRHSCAVDTSSSSIYCFGGVTTTNNQPNLSVYKTILN